MRELTGHFELKQANKERKPCERTFRAKSAKSFIDKLCRIATLASFSSTLHLTFHRALSSLLRTRLDPQKTRQLHSETTSLAVTSISLRSSLLPPSLFFFLLSSHSPTHFIQDVDRSILDSTYRHRLTFKRQSPFLVSIPFFRPLCFPQSLLRLVTRQQTSRQARE